MADPYRWIDPWEEMEWNDMEIMEADDRLERAYVVVDESLALARRWSHQLAPQIGVFAMVLGILIGVSLP